MLAFGDRPSGDRHVTTLPVPSGTPQGFDEDAWDDLLNYMEERRVIPIIGPDLLRVQTDSGLRPLYEWLAEKLALKLSVDPSGLPRPLTLNDVLCMYLGQHGRREEAYTRLRSIMRTGRDSCIATSSRRTSCCTKARRC